MDQKEKRNSLEDIECRRPVEYGSGHSLLSRVHRGDAVPIAQRPGPLRCPALFSALGSGQPREHAAKFQKKIKAAQGLRSWAARVERSKAKGGHAKGDTRGAQALSYRRRPKLPSVRLPAPGRLFL